MPRSRGRPDSFELGPGWLTHHAIMAYAALLGRLARAAVLPALVFGRHGGAPFVMQLAMVRASWR
jgi:hypothetical protein